MNDMMSSNDNLVYVIDETYHIVHFNDVLKNVYPEMHSGDTCYEVLCGNSSPCRKCPLAEWNASTVEMYNEKLKCWVELSTGKIDWPGKGACSIIISRNIPEHQVPAAKAGEAGAEGIHSLTGLYKKGKFFQAMEAFLRDAGEERYCLAAVDIEHFKLFNEWYGKKAGDEFLVNFAKCLREISNEYGGLSGYLGEDDFCLLIPCIEANLDCMQNRILRFVRQYRGNAGFLPAFGVYEITDKSVPASMIYDRAAIAMSMVKGNYAKRMCRYDAVMMQRMEEKHLMLSEVQRGLENGEFTFYLQPKCNMGTGRIVGVESLVRWRHPERGLVTPGAFIPLLEQSGFIAKLDLYIWKEVCRYLRKWLDEGKTLLPISINVSRVDIYTLDVVECLKNMAEEYCLPANLLEIEITESAYAEEYQKITGVAEQLRSAGFTVLMDDFGSGYSSLNMLKDINVDILKIDMKFLDMDEKSADKGLGILEAIIRMATLMGLRIIAEGVETGEQVKVLLEMGCLYGQGYYFFQPLTIESYERLLETPENFDYRGIKARDVKSLRIKDLLNADIFSETLIHNILGGIGIYKVSGGHVELLQVNEHYYKVTGSSPIDLEAQRLQFQSGIYEADRKELLDIFQRADKNRLNGGSGQIRHILADGSVIWIRLHAFFLKAQEDGRIYYGAVSDVTEQRRREQIITENMKTLEIFRSQALYDFKVCLTRKSVCGGSLDSWVGETGCSQIMLLEGASDYMCSELILPRYRDLFRTFTDKDRMYQAYQNGKVMESLDYQRMYKGAPSWMRMLMHYTRSEENGEVYAYIFVTDIDAQKKQELQLARMAETDAMTGLYNRCTAKKKIEDYMKEYPDEESAVIMFDMDNFKTANDVFGHAYGDSMIRKNAEKLNSYFRENDIVCRMGGDEFLVLCRNIREEAVNEKLKQILSDMEVTYHTGKKAIKFSISAGYAMIPRQGNTFDELYRKADTALFTAKMNGKSTFVQYDSGMKEVRPELADPEKTPE